MKGVMQTAVTLGVGYVLGRPRKMRLATITAAAAAGGLGGLAVKRATKMLGSTEALGKLTPQLGELADVVRGDLMGAGKVAAAAVVTSRIESLTGSLQECAEMVRDPAAAASGASNPVRSAAGEAVRSAGGAARRMWRRGQRAAGAEVADEPKDEEEEPYFEEPDEPEGYQPGDGEQESAPVCRRRGPSGRLLRLGRPSPGEECPQRTVHRRAGTRVGDSQ